MNYDVSIVIVSYNSFPDIFECVDSIYKNLSSINFELIIVDNCSTDLIYRSKLLDEKFNHSNCNVILLNSNVGFSRACNIGAANSISSNLFFVNPDIEFMHDSNLMLNNFVNMISGDNSIGAISPMLIKSDGTPDINFRQSIDPFSFLIGRFKKFFFKKGNLSFNGTNILSIAGASLFISSKYFNLISGFDTKYFMYGDDIQLSYDLNKYGLKLHIDSRFFLIHKLGTSSAKKPLKTLYALYISIVKFYSFIFFKFLFNKIILFFVSPFVLVEYSTRILFSKSKKISD